MLQYTALFNILMHMSLKIYNKYLVFAIFKAHAHRTLVLVYIEVTEAQKS